MGMLCFYINIIICPLFYQPWLKRNFIRLERKYKRLLAMYDYDPMFPNV